MAVRYTLTFAFFALLTAGCDTGDDDSGKVLGLAAVESDAGVEASVARLHEALDDDEVAHPLAHVDLSGGGAGPSAQVVLFSHPHLVGSLLEADPRAALDLPFGVLVYAGGSGRARVAYDAPAYLAQRYALDGFSPARLSFMDDTIRRFAAAAAGRSFTPEMSLGYTREGEGVVTVSSEYAAATVYDRFIAALLADTSLTPVALVDLRRDAERHGLHVRYARLVFFEAPALTAPLYAAAPTVGVDLPLKMLVTRDDEGGTLVVYDDPYYLAERHGIAGADAALAEVSALLGRLAVAAATP